MKSTFSSALALTLCLLLIDTAFAVVHKLQPSVAASGDDDAPLLLTPYINSNRIAEALELSRVHGYESILPSSSSYAAYLTVNSSSNGNLFFWFFTAENAVSTKNDAPVVLWLNGGPGASSMGGLFTELGPISLQYDGTNKSWTPSAREWRWSRFSNLLFIDQPVGTGFSFTDAASDDGYVRNEDQVGESLYQFFVQFYQLFPELSQNPLFITGESYAGKYLPALGAAIYQHNTENQNSKNSVKIPLEGVAIGDGWMNPAVQVQSYADFFYNIGMMDRRQAEQVQALATQVATLYAQGNLLAAGNTAEAIINDDFHVSSLFENFTHHIDVYNIMHTSFPSGSSQYHMYLQTPEMLRRIHVGANASFGGNNGKVGHYLAYDTLNDITPNLLVVMQNYRTMIYNGQMDALCGVTFAQEMLERMNATQWPDRDRWFTSQKQIWRVDAKDGEIAGYVKQVDDRFYQIIVRNAGHMVPSDEPRRAYDMIERFINKQPYSAM